MKQVVIKAGQAVGTKLKFKTEGNQQYKRASTDLIITLVEDKQEGSYSESITSSRRLGNDIIYTCRVTLQQALRAEPTTVHTLDGRLIKVPVDHLITPKTVIKIEGEGMPIIGSADPLDLLKRGDMYVKFDIKFPKNLTEG